MPNYVTNILDFDCTPERFREIAESLKMNPEEPLGQVDFNTLIPMPSSLEIESSPRGEKGYEAYKKFVEESLALDDAAKGALEATYRDRFNDDPEIWELGKKYYQNAALYGETTWYDWCWKHWNTPWNAVECMPADTKRCRLVFTTAWSMVPRILLAISRKYPDAGITYHWFEEGVDYSYGDAVLGGGECLEHHNYTHYTDSSEESI